MFLLQIFQPIILGRLSIVFAILSADKKYSNRGNI